MATADLYSVESAPSEERGAAWDGALFHGNPAGDTSLLY